MWNMSSFVCPLEFRYGRDEMRRIFEEESRLNKMLLVEASLAKAHASLGRIPKEDADNIAKTASSSNVALERVKEIDPRHPDPQENTSTWAPPAATSSTPHPRSSSRKPSRS
jgi:hypothetical protein